MLAKRIIPCLDVTGGRVVKGVNFVDLRDAGDPVETARAYEAQGADELTFLDITASSDERETVIHIVEEVARQARDNGNKNIAVIAPAFSADCIETLEEIQEEIRDAFIEAGGQTFTYIPCLNDDDAHIAALSSVIEENLKGWI